MAVRSRLPPRRTTPLMPVTEEGIRMQSTVTMNAPLHWAGHGEPQSFM